MKNDYVTPLSIISVLLLFYGCKPSVHQALIENSKKFRPDEEARALMIKEVNAMEDEFDPEYHSLKTFIPQTANRYHSTRVGMYNHPVRGTSRYAVKLLETGDPGYIERAHKVIEAIIAAQDQDSASETYGIWPYYFEEPLDQMNKPDWNWADFNSVSLLEAYMKYNDLLADDLKEKMKASIIHASYSIKKRDVKPGYTNIAIMGTLVTHLAGQLFGVVDLQEYAYLTKDYCFGTVNRSTTWQQRRPYLIYWGDEKNPRYLSVRLLHDFEDFGIGNIFSSRQKNEALTAMNFATNGGDYHISIDRLKEGKFKATNVRLRFELAAKELKDQINAGPQGLTLRDGDVRVTVNMLRAVFGDEEIKVEKGEDDRLAWVDFVIYKGDEKSFDLSRLDEACFAWYTYIGTAIDSLKVLPEIIHDENRFNARTDDMSISIPVKPALENDLQNDFRIKIKQ